MREIKFRGMTLNKKWVYGNLSILKNHIEFIKPGFYISNSFGMPFAYSVRPETVGQATGLIDKDGRDIYEGDIVTDCYKRLLQVVWQNHAFQFKALKETNFLYAHIGQWFDGLTENPEVIGNIYENPELLEGK